MIDDQAAIPRRDTLRIRHLNDRFRSTLTGGQIVMTAGIHTLPADTIAEILTRVVSFSDFTEGNDPHLEHDFGNFTVGDIKIFFKIDVYDLGLQFASPDPANPAVSKRVLTIMLANEY